MIAADVDEVLLEYCNKVKPFCSARAIFVINKILKDGYITSAELQEAGYAHGARAIGDVRDNGIPIITKRDGDRGLAKYTFGVAANIKPHKVGGRKVFPKNLKSALLALHGARCAISKQDLPEKDLQIDHRVPYLLSGDAVDDMRIEKFMLLSRSMQRAKSWECENCANVLRLHDQRNCLTCYWASPDSYTHVALRVERRLDLVYSADDIGDFDRLKMRAFELMEPLPIYAKAILRNSS